MAEAARRRVGASASTDEPAALPAAATPSSKRPRTTPTQRRRHGAAMLLALIGAALFLSDDGENASNDGGVAGVDISSGGTEPAREDRELDMSEEGRNWTSLMPKDPILLEPGQAWSKPLPSAEELLVGGNSTSEENLAEDSMPAQEILPLDPDGPPPAEPQQAGPDDSEDAASIKSELADGKGKESDEKQSLSSADADGGGGHKCLISSASKGSVGHQLEAQLSCVGAAALYPRSLTYVHRPLRSDRRTKARDATSELKSEEALESLFSISGALEALGGVSYDTEKMTSVERAPSPPLGACGEPSWFDSVNVTTCQAVTPANDDDNDGDKIEPGKAPVFEADNCWDAFWCGLARRPEEAARAWREGPLPALRESYQRGAAAIGDSSTEGETDLTKLATGSAADQREVVLSVAVHVRQRTDESGSRAEGLSYYAKVLESLRGAAAAMRATASDDAAVPLLRLVVYTEHAADEVARGLGFNFSASTFKVDSPITVRLDGGSTPAVVHGPSAPVPHVMRRMIESNLLVSSRSSLATAAALLRDDDLDGAGAGAGVIYPEAKERGGALALGWAMLKLDDDGALERADMASSSHPTTAAEGGAPLGLRGNATSTGRRLRTKKPKRSGVKWLVVEDDFWIRLLEQRMAAAMERRRKQEQEKATVKKVSFVVP